MRATRFPASAAGPAERLAVFVAHLRLNGIAVGPFESAAALEALGSVTATDPAQARLALRAVLAGDADSWDRFGALFDAYWFNAGRQRAGTASAHVRVQSARPTLWQPHLDANAPSEAQTGEEGPQTPDDSAEDTAAEGMDGRLIATRTEALSRRDLRALVDEASLAEAERVAERLARAIRDRRSRRLRMARRGARPDLRRVLRSSLARGGEPLELHYKQRPDRPMRVVALCDVSGSMSVYARVFLAFVKGLIGADSRAEAFLFHTRLMRVTSALQDRDALRSATRLSLMAEGFGGGTDIGAALHGFCDTYGARTLTRRSVVIVMSDGYCTGPAGAVGAALARMRRRAGRIVWLNPLLGWRDYAPVTAAMQAALPHLDAFRPAHTLAALADLEDDFARL